MDKARERNDEGHREVVRILQSPGKILNVIQGLQFIMACMFAEQRSHVNILNILSLLSLNILSLLSLNILSLLSLNILSLHYNYVLSCQQFDVETQGSK